MLVRVKRQLARQAVCFVGKDDLYESHGDVRAQRGKSCTTFETLFSEPAKL